MSSIRNILITALLISGMSASAQDSLLIMQYDDFIDIVRGFHPVMVKASLLQPYGEAFELKARGGFDPKAMVDYNQKYLKDTRYYRIFNGGLHIPTWFGLEVNAGYDQTSGEFLNPEEFTNTTGLYHAGLALNVGRGLFIDERRAELRQADIFVQSTEAQRKLMLNDLILKAGTKYWEWYQSYQNVRIYQNALDLATFRLGAIRQEVAAGDRAPIDTLEATLQVQNRLLAYQSALVKFENAGQMLSTFLWDENGFPLQVSPDLLPDTSAILEPELPVEALLTQSDSLLSSHPEMLVDLFALESMRVDRRLTAENLKPKFKLKYNAISEPVNGDPINGYSINDYVFGLEFGMPLFLRKERGELRIADLEIREAEVDLSAQLVNLRADFEMARNTLINTSELIEIYVQTVRDFKGLLEGERQLFEAGESSLFMVNAREQSYISAQLTLVSLFAQNRIAAVELQHALATVN